MLCAEHNPAAAKKGVQRVEGPLAAGGRGLTHSALQKDFCVCSLQPARKKNPWEPDGLYTDKGRLVSRINQWN